MSNNFCRYLSNTLYFQVTNNDKLYVSPCCFYDNKKPLHNYNELENFRNQFNKVDSFDAGHCQACKRHEEFGYYDSLRLRGFNQMSKVDDTRLLSLFLQIDPSCNAACIMCNETLSTQWRTLKIKKENIVNLIDSSTLTTEYIDKIISKLDLSALETVTIIGGEPFYSDSQLEILKLIPNPQNVVLKYSTNASIFPNDETINLWKKFNKVVISLSIDDIGDRFEYIRWPLQWHQVDNNVQKFLQLEKEMNCWHKVHATINPLNVYYINELEDYVRDIFEISGDIYNINRFEIQDANSSAADLHYATPSLAKSVVEKFGAEHNVTKMLNAQTLQNSSSFLAFLEHQEKLRNTSRWQDVFPEIVQYFN